MKLRLSLTCLLALSLTACNTLEVGVEMTLTPSSPSLARAASSPTFIPTAQPTDRLVPTRTSQPTLTPLPPTSTPSPLPTATPTIRAKVKPAPSQTPTPASPSIASKCDPSGPDNLPTPAFFFKSPEGKIYFLDGSGEKHGVDQDTWANLGYEEKDIVVGGSMELSYPEGAPFTRLIKGSSEEVYWMENGFRRHIPDMDTFRQLGYRQKDIFQIFDNALLSWPLSEPLPSVLGTSPEPVPTGSAERVVSSYRPFDRHARASELYTVYVDGARPRRLSYTTGYAYQSRAAWSPDGRSIAFAQCLAHMPDNTSCEAFTTGPDRWNPTWLTKEGYIADLGWSPDGKQLAYSTQFIFLMNRDGSHQRETEAESWRIAWTPDGRIAFWVREGEPGTDKYKLMVMDADGQNMQPVEEQVTVFDQRYFPWRQCTWVAGSPD